MPPFDIALALSTSAVNPLLGTWRSALTLAYPTLSEAQKDAIMALAMAWLADSMRDTLTQEGKVIYSALASSSKVSPPTFSLN